MPQLDVFTFTAQAFWTLVTFLSIYIVVTKFILPKLGLLLKIRQRLLLNIMLKIVANNKKALSLKKLCKFAVKNNIDGLKIKVKGQMKELSDANQLLLLNYYVGEEGTYIFKSIVTEAYNLELSDIQRR